MPIDLRYRGEAAPRHRQSPEEKVPTSFFLPTNFPWHDIWRNLEIRDILGQRRVKARILELNEFRGGRGARVIDRGDLHREIGGIEGDMFGVHGFAGHFPFGILEFNADQFVVPVFKSHIA